MTGTFGEGSMPPRNPKIKQIRRVLKVPKDGSWEWQYNFTPQQVAKNVLEESDIERCFIECTEFDSPCPNSESDSDFQTESDERDSDQSGDGIHGNSSSSSSSDSSVRRRPMRRARLGNHDPLAVCSGCDLSEYKSVHHFYENEVNATDFLIKHGVFPSMDTVATCQDCYGFMEFDQESFDHNSNPLAGWSCQRRPEWIKKTKKGKKNRRLKRCKSSNNPINLRTGTFIEGTTLPCWKTVLMGVAFCQRDNRHSRIQENVGVCAGTSARYRKIFLNATVQWVENQEAIGGTYPAGAPKIVELDETLFVSKRNLKQSRHCTDAIWVFGGVERHSKKSFLYPLTKVCKSKKGATKWVSSLLRDSSTLIPIILKMVKPGSIIITDGWTAYLPLNDYGYFHHRVIHLTEWVVASKPWIHTQTIERLWGDLKDFSLQRGQKKEYLKEIVGRYIFLCSFSNLNSIHELFILLGQKYRHPFL